jgi:exopolysaccharide biosynthesis polyprenyl glycosylphosphotransferase
MDQHLGEAQATPTGGVHGSLQLSFAECIDEPRPTTPRPATNDHPPAPAAQASSLKLRLMSADLAAVLTGSLVAIVLQELVRPVPIFVLAWQLALLLCSLPLFVAGAMLARLYQARANERPEEERRNIYKAVAVYVGGHVMLAFVVQYEELSRLWVIALALCTTLALIVERGVARRIFTKLRRQGRLRRLIVIIGTDAHAMRLLHTFQRRPDLGYEVLGFIGRDDIGQRGGVGVLGTIDEIEAILASCGASGAVVSPSSVPDEDANALARRLTDLGYHVTLSSNLRDIDTTRLRPQQFDGYAMFYIEPAIRHGWRSYAKRAFDLTAASVVLLFTLPVLLSAMLAIYLEDRGPVLFRQVRIGRDGRQITLLKLRTMVIDAEARKADLLDRNEMDGPLFKIADDPRITRVGRVLRKLSIDELPQLLNVVQGSMSMVGPRPALPDEVEQWDDAVHERLRVLPGITGMWQVSGRSSTNFEEYKRLDLYYVDNWSLKQDVRICAKTVSVVLMGRGAA